MPYLLYEKTKSNHKNIIGLFEQKSQAEIYVEMLKSKSGKSFQTKMCMTPVQYKYHVQTNFLIEKIEFLDESPEITEFILMPAQI